MKNWIVKNEGEFFCADCGHAVDQEDASCWYCSGSSRREVTPEQMEVVAAHSRKCALQRYEKWAREHPGEPNLYRHIDTQREYGKAVSKSPYQMAG